VPLMHTNVLDHYLAGDDRPHTDQPNGQAGGQSLLVTCTIRAGVPHMHTDRPPPDAYVHRLRTLCMCMCMHSHECGCVIVCMCACVQLHKKNTSFHHE